MTDETTPNYHDLNLAAFTRQSERRDPQFPEESYLSLKATNKIEHEGGESIKRGAAAHAMLNSLNKRIAGLQDCKNVTL